MAKKEKSLMRQLIDERGIKDVAGVQALVKELTAGLIQVLSRIMRKKERGHRFDAQLTADSTSA
jgi:hypothetical protein